jgi:hypothetical protein
MNDAIIKPLSRGNVSPNPSNMGDTPVINMGWLTNRTDHETAVVTIKKA